MGDSLAFLSRGGVCHDLSEAHVVANPAEKERMRKAGHEVKDTQTRVNGLFYSFSLLCFALLCFFFPSIFGFDLLLSFLTHFSLGLSVSRALGDHFVKDSDLGIVNTPFISKPVLLNSDDNLLIVASDGVCFSFSSPPSLLFFSPPSPLVMGRYFWPRSD